MGPAPMRVSVKLSNGERFDTVTATPTFQMGRFAIVQLIGRAGTWLVSTLTGLDH